VLDWGEEKAFTRCVQSKQKEDTQKQMQYSVPEQPNFMRREGFLIQLINSSRDIDEVESKTWVNRLDVHD
jgi:hypothetical protein